MTDTSVARTAGADGAGGALTFADLPSVDGPWPEDAPALDLGRDLPRAPRADRRTVLRGLIAAGAASATVALGVFPRARPALAHHSNNHYGYRVAGGGCPSYAGSHNCSPGCGPSPVFSDTCVTSGPYEGWFKNDPTRGFRLRPDQCLPGADAWKWRYSGRCGRCSRVVEYRCHDGYRRSGSSWYNAICREVTECDGVDPDRRTNNPVGQVRVFQVLGGRHLRVTGWAIDPNHTRLAVPIEVKRGSIVMASKRAGAGTWSIPPLFRRFGLRHGFDIRIRDLPVGTYTVRVNAVNLGPGRTVTLASKRITIPPR